MIYQIFHNQIEVLEFLNLTENKIMQNKVIVIVMKSNFNK